MTLTFYRFAITFRHSIGEVHEHRLHAMNRFFFANQMYRDKNFPAQSDSYDELKKYVNEHYREDISDEFEQIWCLYIKTKENLQENKRNK